MDKTKRIELRLTESDYEKVKSEASLAGLSTSEFIRQKAIHGKTRFSLDHFPGVKPLPDGRGLLSLPDSTKRTVQKHFYLTEAEDHLLRRASRNAGMTQSRFIVERVIRAPMYFLGDPEFFQKYFSELHSMGNNLNQIAHALNTIALIGNLPGITPTRFNQLFTEAEDLLAVVDKPLVAALTQTQALMVKLKEQVKESAERNIEE